MDTDSLDEQLPKDARIIAGLYVAKQYTSWMLVEAKKKKPDMKWMRRELEMMQEDLEILEVLFIKYRIQRQEQGY